MNNCARILIGLSRILKRQPTAEEYSAFVAELPQGEYMYVPVQSFDTSKDHVRAVILDKRAQGKSLRRIAREVQLSHEFVRKVCQQIPPTELTPTP